MKGHSIRASVLIGIALSILLVPIQWVAAWILAVTAHEVCHYVAARSCGGVVDRIHVGASGARMEVWGLGYWQEMLCALAGPSSCVFLLSVARWFPRTAVCSLALSVFNMMPIYPLDGGRVVRSVFHAILPPTYARRLCDIIQGICLIVLLLLGVHSTMALQAGIVPLAVSVLLAFRWSPRKRPCNDVMFSVQ